MADSTPTQPMPAQPNPEWAPPTGARQGAQVNTDPNAAAQPNREWAPPTGAPQGVPFSSDPSASGRPKMSKGKKVGIGVAAFLAIGIIGGALGSDPKTTPTATPAVSSSSTTTVDAAAAKAEADAKAAADKAAKEAEAKAAAEKAAAEKAAAEKAAAEKAAAAAAAAAAKAEKAKTDPSTYSKISARSFAKVAKDPDSYVGKKYVIYGYVSQFDSATGTETFRASVDGVKRGDWYDYETNSIVNEGIPGIFENVVQDDLVTLYVVVEGSLSYDTQIGGSTTVPLFTANIVKVTGSTN